MKKTMLAAALTCTLAGMALIAAPNVRADNYNLGSIMPLGDSITMGYPVEGGYRDPLYDRLDAHGYTFSFVGSSAENPSSTLTDAGQAQHEGHSGYFIWGGNDLSSPPIVSGNVTSGLYENLDDWIGPGKASPNIILLMAGTNDMYHDYQRATAPDRLTALIDQIYYYQPSVSLFVASIAPLKDAAKDAYAQTYNAAIPGIVSDQRAFYGRNVWFVDMYGALTTGNLYGDGVHLADSGDEKMAQAWYDAVTSVPEPNTLVLLATGLLGLLAYAWQKHRNWNTPIDAADPRDLSAMDVRFTRIG